MRSVLLTLCAVLLFTACGKKGNPLPPLVRVPAAPGDFAVSRIEDDVYVRFTVPSTNVDGVRPADIARVEVYALTLDGVPPDFNNFDPEDLREAATLVATEPVRPPVPPPVATKEGAPQVPPPPPPPGSDQGASVVVHEPLSSEARNVATLPRSRFPRIENDDEEDEDVFGPLVAPTGIPGLQRYYFAVAVSPRGRYGPHSGVVPAPLGATSGPPSAPRITVKEDSMTLEWTAPVDARGLGLASDPEWLPSTPVVPGPPPTTYDVYEVPRNQSSDAPAGMPTPLTPAPTGETTFTQENITFGVERCFYVRSVDIVDGVHVRGPASPTACASFADTFPPSAPSDLVAVAVPGGINLIWEPSQTDDVAGYLVLRAEAGSATLTPLTVEPVTTPAYRDNNVTAGVRYVYAVIAVDRAGNRSDESNRVEETAQ